MCRLKSKGNINSIFKTFFLHLSNNYSKFSADFQTQHFCKFNKNIIIYDNL